MRVLYLSCYFNHHQKPLADAMYSLLGSDYSFVETTGVPEFRKALGYQEITAPYVIRYDSQTKESIDRLILNADVVIYGEAPLKLIKARYDSGKLTLRDDESRYKNPNRYLKWPIYTYKSHWINKGYLLCASAYAPIDYLLSGMSPSKCFRWGYFPEVKKYKSPEILLEQKRLRHRNVVSILWAGRLIKLKHPEAAIYVAQRLKRDGILFDLNIIGTGSLERKLMEKIKKDKLEDCVHLLGPMTPSEVRKYMEEADVFLFTSDRCEGWGAVLNESMNSGCAVVADYNIGSTPYLINDGKNGLYFKSTDYKDLYEKVRWLANNPEEMKSMGKQAYLTMVQRWNGDAAAKSLITLCEALLSGAKNSPILEGPCSQAPLIMRKFKGLFSSL